MFSFTFPPHFKTPCCSLSHCRPRSIPCPPELRRERQLTKALGARRGEPPTAPGLFPVVPAAAIGVGETLLNSGDGRAMSWRGV